jgi:SAM-dependent methyltransferase
MKNKPKNLIYGESTFKGILTLIKDMEKDGVTEDDVFLDIGSGYGKVPKSVTEYFQIKSYGIEFDKEKHDMARKINRYGSRYPVKFINGDYRDYMDIVNEATIIYGNIIMFDEELVDPLFKNVVSRNNVILYHNSRFLQSVETLNISSSWSLDGCKYYKINTKQRG